ncbi:MAG: hypothetical protein ACRD96_26615, partial [Bryobacteraceae bacterium]
MMGTPFAVRIRTFLAVLGLLGGMGIGRSQSTDTIISTRVTSLPPGLVVYVDSQRYVTPVNFLWPVGSKHHLRADTELGGGVDFAVSASVGTRYVFRDWTEGRTSRVIHPAGSTEVVVTAHPDAPEFVATFQVQYLLRIVYFNCSGNLDETGECPATISPGSVWVGPIRFTQDGSLWVSAGPVLLQATPNPGIPEQDLQGWIFIGWYIGPAPDSQAFLSGIT